MSETRAVLGEGLVGVYAAGSVALDAYEPGHSDVDVAVVCRRRLTLAEKSALVTRLRHESLPCPARGLELVVYTRDAAASGSPEPSFEVELNTGATMSFRATYDPQERPPEHGRFWYALDRAILHDHGLALLGPPASEVFASPAAGDLRALLDESLRWWRERTRAAANPSDVAGDAVLGACRALVRHRYGVWASKADAARRVLADGLAPAAVVRAALAARTGGVPPTGAQAREVQDRVLRELGAGR